MTDSAEVAFILTYNVAQLPDDSDVTFQLVQPEILNFEDFWSQQQPPTFFSFAEPFDGVDYPINDQNIVIMSKKAFQVIEQLNPDHGCDVAGIEVINTVLDPVGDPREDLMESADLITASRGNPRYSSDRFFAVRPPLLAGVFDRQHSKYETDSRGEVGAIDEYVLHLEADTTPPLFMIPEHLGKVFVTASLRRAWQRQGITGMAYYRLTLPWTDIEIDRHGQLTNN